MNESWKLSQPLHFEQIILAEIKTVGHYSAPSQMYQIKYLSERDSHISNSYDKIWNNSIINKILFTDRTILEGYLDREKEKLVNVTSWLVVDFPDFVINEYRKKDGWKDFMIEPVLKGSFPNSEIADAFSLLKELISAEDPFSNLVFRIFEKVKTPMILDEESSNMKDRYRFFYEKLLRTIVAEHLFLYTLGYEDEENSRFQKDKRFRQQLLELFLEEEILVKEKLNGKEMTIQEFYSLSLEGLSKVYYKILGVLVENNYLESSTVYNLYNASFLRLRELMNYILISNMKTINYGSFAKTRINKIKISHFHTKARTINYSFFFEFLKEVYTKADKEYFNYIFSKLQELNIFFDKTNCLTLSDIENFFKIWNSGYMMMIDIREQYLDVKLADNTNFFNSNSTILKFICLPIEANIPYYQPYVIGEFFQISQTEWTVKNIFSSIPAQRSTGALYFYIKGIMPVPNNRI